MPVIILYSFFAIAGTFGIAKFIQVGKGPVDEATQRKEDEAQLKAINEWENKRNKKHN